MGFEKRDLGPVALKFGVAFALSLGGILCSFIINKRIKHSKSSPPELRKRSDCNNQMNSRSNHQSSQTATSSLQFDPLTKDKHDELHHSNSPVPDISSNTKSNGDKDDLVMKTNVSFKKDTELVRPDIGSPKGCSRADEQEIKSLRNTVKVLKERERTLEIKLLEYYGLKEQETAVMELQNRLKLNNMEAKFFTLKIESLQADNKRLQAQMTDHTKIVADLEAARAKIKALKKKVRSEAEQHKKQILDFQQRVQKMQELDEQNHVVRIDTETESSLRKLKELEAEVEELRKSNQELQLENSDLAHRLDCVQILATSVLEDGETEKLKEESEILKKQNDELSKEIERLQGDRLTDVEEVVYLKWINACLRYELRNYQPGRGKTTARDLSKTLSPKSEEKAKQLILDYANKEGTGEKNINLSEIDSDQWSSSQASIITDPGEMDESCNEDPPTTHKNHNKFFGKLLRLIRGKDSPNQQQQQRNHSRNSSLGRSESGGEDLISFCSSENQRLRTPPGGSSKPKKLTHRHSTDACFYKQKNDTIAEGGRSSSGGGGRRSFSSSLYSQKSDLTKYAEALKGTRATASNFKCHRSSPSLGYI